MLVQDNFEIKVIDLFQKDDELEDGEKIDYQGAENMFLAPEARGYPESRESQVYSLGCLLYLIIELKDAGPLPNEISPFKSNFNYADCKKVTKFLIVNKMMSPDPKDRPSFDEIRAEMEEIEELPQEERLPLVVPALDSLYFEKDYTIVDRIARGGQGSVFIVLDNLTGNYRIAKVNMKGERDHQAMKEN